MKKLFKLVSLAAFAAGVAWMLRDQLLPGPQQPTAHPPPFRNPPPPPEEAKPEEAKPNEAMPAVETATEQPNGDALNLQDDLTAVNGIGPVYAKRLAGAGIKSFSDLAEADAEDLANRTDLQRDRVADWIRKASDLA